MKQIEKLEGCLTCSFATLAIFLLAAFIIVGCSAPRQATQLVRDVRTDTVYLSNVQYDSIYISQDKLIDRTKDTLYIRDVSVEYRYKFLRDTVRIVERDSIPYEVTIVETKEITRPLTLFDKICRWSFTFLLILVLLYIRRIVKKFHKP